jgi:hypothetical protein
VFGILKKEIGLVQSDLKSVDKNQELTDNQYENS